LGCCSKELAAMDSSTTRTILLFMVISLMLMSCVINGLSYLDHLGAWIPVGVAGAMKKRKQRFNGNGFDALSHLHCYTKIGPLKGY